MATKMQQLTDTAKPYWDAEGEIARRFYKTAKSEDHAFYLRAQAEMDKRLPREAK